MSYKFYQNKACEYFPCHPVEGEEKFNCLFCYCPLYLLKKDCGGSFRYSHNIKDCSFCLIPHGEKGYDYIISKMEEVMKRSAE